MGLRRWPTSPASSRATSPWSTSPRTRCSRSSGPLPCRRRVRARSRCRSGRRCSSRAVAISRAARPHRLGGRAPVAGRLAELRQLPLQGLTDGVVWFFGPGPRKSIPMSGSFNPRNRTQQRILNYSAQRDETQDFTLNVRNVSGPGHWLPPSTAVRRSSTHRRPRRSPKAPSTPTTACCWATSTSISRRAS